MFGFGRNSQIGIRIRDQTRADIRQMDQLVLEGSDSEVCAICLESVTSIGVANACRHRFCVQCLTEWTAEHNYCPLCRQVIEAVFAVTHRRHQNDFDLIVVDNAEARHRQHLMDQKNELRQTLVRERKRRIEQINALKQRMQDIDHNLIQLDGIRHENNATVEEILNAIIAQRQNFSISGVNINEESVAISSAATMQSTRSSTDMTLESIDSIDSSDPEFEILSELLSSEALGGLPSESESFQTIVSETVRYDPVDPDLDPFDDASEQTQ